ncbi:8-oxo-dGTP pyrophosphatase MutT, NUDIX family [Devosia sp. YR412]|uniref:NUDIX hydrolase n=1 Tax=Devosia sp. YR412 TaxID=1881030 RepID=UPI0008D093AC|nr:NUDIX hydrolase [Devosia sp. YR412]SEP63629.1 8-oxo-dGTP pyrophosphatase MutT, NUDIX family [Devosia sp. YR412]
MAKSAADIIGETCDQVAALPWRQSADGKIRILLITSRTNDKWMLPKGWRMSSKADYESALIEAREEAGIDGEVSQVPIGSYRYIKLFDDGRSMPAQAGVFPVCVTSQREKWDEKHQRSRRWVRPKKAVELVFEPDLSRFLTDLHEEVLLRFAAPGQF